MKKRKRHVMPENKIQRSWKIRLKKQKKIHHRADTGPERSVILQTIIDYVKFSGDSSVGIHLWVVNYYSLCQTFRDRFKKLEEIVSLWRSPFVWAQTDTRSWRKTKLFILKTRSWWSSKCTPRRLTRCTRSTRKKKNSCGMKVNNRLLMRESKLNLKNWADEEEETPGLDTNWEQLRAAGWLKGAATDAWWYKGNTKNW